MRAWTVATVVACLVVGCSSEEPRPRASPVVASHPSSAPSPVAPATAEPEPAPAPIVLRGQKDAPRRIKGESAPKTDEEIAADEAADRRALEIENKDHAKRDAAIDRAAGDRAKIAAAGDVVDHVAGVDLVQESGRLLIRFELADAKGDRLALPGRVTVYTRSSAQPPGRAFYSTDNKGNLTKQWNLAVKAGPETVATEQDVTPEGSLYRLTAIDCPKGAFDVRLVFALRSGRTVEGKASDVGR